MHNVVLYHAGCNDGFGAALVCYIAHQQGKLPGEIEFHAVQYGQPVPDFPVYSNVFIVDFSYPKEVIADIADRARGVVIIDHHISVKKDLESIDIKNVSVVFDNSQSGAMLTWKYFYQDEPPVLIKYLQDYDLYRFEFGEHTHYVDQYLSHIAVRSFEAWKNILCLLDDGGALGSQYDIMQAGKGLYESMLDRIDKTIERSTMMVMFGDYSCIPLVNSNAPISERNAMLNKLAKEHDFAVSFMYVSDKIVFNLRADRERGNGIELGMLAKSLGKGGGHDTAASFSLPISKGMEFIARCLTTGGFAE